jgi:hypothetical protein
MECGRPPAIFDSNQLNFLQGGAGQQEKCRFIYFQPREIKEEIA